MFPFRRRLIPPPRKAPKRPAWLNWLLLAFVAYGIAIVSMPGDHTPRQTFQKARENVSQATFGDLSGYSDKIFPEHAAGLKISEVSEGTGMPAVCGQTVKLAYESFLAQGNALPDKATKDNPLTFTIGDGKVMPAFDRGTIGMKQGGKRSLIAPPLMSYGIEQYKRDDVPSGASVRIETELLSIEPSLPDIAAMPYRIAEVSVGSGPMILCGEPAQLRVKVWDLAGKEIFSNLADASPLVLTPGRNSQMLGLEQGAIGMLEGGVRLLIIPPDFQKTLGGGAPALNMPLPENQTIMLEVRAMSPAPTADNGK